MKVYRVAGDCYGTPSGLRLEVDDNPYAPFELLEGCDDNGIAFTESELLGTIAAMLQAYVDRTGMKPIDVFDKLNVSPLRSTRARAF